jgi:subtilisin-like proprotein convertase family protein
MPTQLAKVTVRLNSLSHNFPSDIDILLVGPQGQTAVIMSDVGGGTVLNAVTLTLHDDAALPLPTSAIVAGTYKPTNIGLADPFPAPAPAQAGGSALSVFQGTNPNGEWRLFIVDDVAIDGGTLVGGWTLTLTAAISGQNTGAITIPESGAASPYPSEISIANLIDPVSRVQVNLVNFSHASPDDVDVLLVSPSGRSVVLMSDVGGSNAVSNLNLSFEDLATASLPDNAALTSGTYKPTDFEPGDTFPPPGGPPTGRTLSSFNGTVANGAWKLFVVDDSGNNVGSVTGGWSILVSTTAGTISIAGTGIASPYPAEISVSGLDGSITSASVTISNFSHIAPDDVDILLVGPDGRRIVLMSDAGGQTEVGGINLNFSDAAPAPVPDESILNGGTYKPADYEPGETFPAPAPAGPVTGTTLNAFYGGVPNGVWRLYVVGDGPASRFGSIAGTWTLTLQTSVSACLFSLSPSVVAIPVGGGSGGFGVQQPNGCAWTASTTEPFVHILSGGSGGGNGSVGFSVDANQGPARTGTILVSNGITTRTFQIQQPSGCPLSISSTEVNFAATGGTANVNVSAGGGCSWQGSTFANWIQITSPPQSGNGTLTFSVQPNARANTSLGIRRCGLDDDHCQSSSVASDAVRF